MNKEIYHEGWLIKSPPTKRIWRARWRRRWFTLKQGEIPGQFCLEYYTDRNCRKLKGVIDLDQCEQVDSGLRLEHRKQKFQFMFDIKTPRRIYYLAADTESDMRDWVNCICQVCNLHDFTKEQQQQGDRQYYNLGENGEPIQNESLSISASDRFNDTQTTSLNNISLPEIAENQLVTPDVIRRAEHMSISNTYQSNDSSYVNTEYSQRETVLCDSRLDGSTLGQLQNSGAGKVPLTESGNIERSQSFRQNSTDRPPIIPNHARAQSLNDQSTSRTLISSSGIVKKIPENLVLSNTTVEGSVEPSPALSTSSGPYIPISECFSGSPKFLNEENPQTPLNNLDPKFYDTPRSHNNIGLNLTNDQSYSPKIYNCPPQIRPRSGRSSPTDSESVFTDDEEWSHPMPLRENVDRNMRPSDSSVENDAVVFTYTQRFSKVPDDGKTVKKTNVSDTISEEEDNLSKRGSTEEPTDKKLRDIPQLSDTENTSPAIGPKDASSCVEESYDIPRSHHLPYFNMSQFRDQPLSPEGTIAASSTPNLISDSESRTSTLSRTLSRPHFYTNAAPCKVEGNVFRYDFVEQTDVPPVNRSLKPKLSFEDKSTAELTPKPPVPIPPGVAEKTPAKPPSVDRKLKPPVFRTPEPATMASSLRRPGIPTSLVLSSDTDFGINHKEFETRTLPRSASIPTNPAATRSTSTSTLSQPKSHSTLQYFDLDVANPPPQINRAIYSNNATSSHGFKLGSSLDAAIRPAVKSSVVYNSVDFVKTEAFKRVREESEKNRMNN